MVEERKDKREEDKKIKKESALKKFLKKRSFIYLMAAVFFVVFIVPDMIAQNDMAVVVWIIPSPASAPEVELMPLLEEKTDEQNIAWDIIKSYKGIDDDGYNLFDTIITQIENAYPNEKILGHRDTGLYVSAEKIPRKASMVIYEVNFTFKTYNAMEKYIWNVNIETEEIIPLNDGAKKMMNIVDFYD